MSHVEAARQPPSPAQETRMNGPDEPPPEDTRVAPPGGSSAPALTIAGESAAEADGVLRFTVSLSRAAEAAVTVAYETEDGTAAAGQDYAAASGTLTFGAGVTARTIVVPVLPDTAAEQPETFTVTLSDPNGATLLHATGTGTIADEGDGSVTTVADNGDATRLELVSLQVTGGSAMYPAFAADVLHYALHCEDPTTLSITAQAAGSDTRLTLLRADEADNQVSIGTLTAQITVHENHDVAIELAAAGATITYVVHCIPTAFPTINVLRKTDQVTDGLILATPRWLGRLGPPMPGIGRSVTSYIAIFDNNGVPRFQRRLDSSSGRQFMDFRRHPDGRYSVRREVDRTATDYRVDILDSQFNVTKTEGVVFPLTHTDGHDFVIVSEGTGAGNYLFLSLAEAEHDFTSYGAQFAANQTVLDSVIQEVTPEGEEVFRWNSWEHREVMQLGNDCRLGESDYAHINSLQLIDGDLVASFRNCRQVLRIDRSGGTGAVLWKLGGSAPPAGSATEYLEISGDPEGEFCGQHHATLTGSDTVVLFDNGVLCLGARKDESSVTRVVEYDISSGTEARYERSFSIPSGNGIVYARGGVTVLGSGADTRWLIAWGGIWRNDPAALHERIEISEVVPASGTSGTVHLHLNMSTSSRRYDTYRAYRYPEADVSPPLNLP